MKQRSESEILHLAASYCSTAERCIQDVRKKITSAGASPEAEERIIERLLKENFINESRYCRSFVKDKFRFNGWGRSRISYELQLKGILPDVFSKAILLIDEEEYRTALFDLLKKKKRTIKGYSEQDIFNKLYRFAAGRGFESNLVIQQLREIFNENFDVDS